MNKIQKFLGRFLIPRGFYCYSIQKGAREYCPFYFVDGTKRSQENGYCSYIGKGDWDINEEHPKIVEINRRQPDGTYKKEMIERIRDSIFWEVGLLFDACKECGTKLRGGKYE